MEAIEANFTLFGFGFVICSEWVGCEVKLVVNSQQHSLKLRGFGNPQKN